MKLVVKELINADGDSVDAVPHPVMLFKMPVPFPVAPGALVRRATAELREV